MNIVYACDNNFVSVLAVSLLSLIKYNLQNSLKIYILDDNISFDNKAILQNVCCKAGIIKEDLNFIPTNEQLLDSINLKLSSLPRTTYARLYVCEYLPEDCKKALYLDCDTMINGDLSTLW